MKDFINLQKWSGTQQDPNLFMMSLLD